MRHHWRRMRQGTPRTARAWLSIGFTTVLLMGAPAARAQDLNFVSCWMWPTTNPTSVVYTGSTVDVAQSVYNRCMRGPYQPSVIRLAVVANRGNNPYNYPPYRRVRLGATQQYLPYSLARGSQCLDQTNWTVQPPLSAADVPNLLQVVINATGAMDSPYERFLGGEQTSPICIRIHPYGGLPAAGVYTDTIVLEGQSTPDFKSFVDFGLKRKLDLQVHVPAQCTMRVLGNINIFYYRAFAPQGASASQQAWLACSVGTPWTATIDPPNGVLMDLPYTLTVSPNRGTGHGFTQVLTIEARIPPGLGGTCHGAAALCTAKATHTLTIHY